LSNIDNLPGWRALLETLIADDMERQRIAHTLNINPITLTRWATGITHPRHKHLYALLDALPDVREQLISLIIEEYPEFRIDFAVIEELSPTIPSAFYAQVLEAYNQQPSISRSAKIRDLVLKQMLTHLDAQHKGMLIMVNQCTPTGEQKVRSLHLIDGQGTPPWQQIFPTIRFFGLETQIGYAVQMHRPITIHSYKNTPHWQPIQDEHEESMITYPLIRADQIAGSLTIISTQAYYFTDIHRELIEHYTDLFLLAFEEADFHAFERIAVGIMPSSPLQKTLTSQFNQRLHELIIVATHERRHQTLSDATLQVYQQMEQELLLFASTLTDWQNNTHSSQPPT
jgi:hypothetical protein